MPFFPFVTIGVLLLIICKPFEVTAVRSGCVVVVATVVPPPIPFVRFKLSGIAAFVALNSAGEMPSAVDKLIAIGGLCAFKPFDMAVRPFGKIFGESANELFD